jgi:hypothetical protein
MSDREAVLFANDAFYVCFAGNDYEGLERLWARTAPVTCIHPGWEALYGRGPVMESWLAIIQNGAPAIQCREPRVALYGDTATVICYERAEGGYLIATNVFVREDGEWRMTHHQAGPTRGAPAPEVEGGPPASVN